MGVLSIEIIHGDRQMAITVTQFIRLSPSLVDGQLNFEIGFRIAQVNKGETVEIEPIGHLQSERSLVERDRFLLIQDADHGVNALGQIASNSLFHRDLQRGQVPLFRFETRLGGVPVQM